MHVMIVTQLPADRARPEGGVVAVVANLIRGLVGRGVEVTAVEWGSSRSDAFDDTELGCRVLPLPLRHPAFLMNLLSSAREVSRIEQAVRPDLSHVEMVPELGWHLKGRLVYSVHGVAHRDEWLY